MHAIVVWISTWGVEDGANPAWSLHDLRPLRVRAVVLLDDEAGRTRSSFCLPTEPELDYQYRISRRYRSCGSSMLRHRTELSHQ